ncbi:MAG: DUF721 domain-containing protein [Candidatus Gastranaerophilales bacterium]|nr:DUF721 domain-containing protein [Candidatus Gastranaerophilales bacterium]
MKKMNNSDFVTINEIIKNLDIQYNENKHKKEEIISECWRDTAGEKIINFARFYAISDDNVLTIVCSDSFVANELFFSKDKFIEFLNLKLKNTGYEIRDMIFDYKKWEEKNNEIR